MQIGHHKYFLELTFKRYPIVFRFVEGLVIKRWALETLYGGNFLDYQLSWYNQIIVKIIVCFQDNILLREVQYVLSVLP